VTFLFLVFALLSALSLFCQTGQIDCDLTGSIFLLMDIITQVKADKKTQHYLISLHYSHVHVHADFFLVCRPKIILQNQ
jgi:hypothetical protein